MPIQVYTYICITHICEFVVGFSCMYLENGFDALFIFSSINEFKKNERSKLNDFKVSFRCKIHYMFDMFIYQSRALGGGGYALKQ